MFKIDLQPDTVRLDGRPLVPLVNSYLDDRENHVQPYTVAGYRQKLRWFLHWWTDHATLFNWTLDAAALSDFEHWLTQQESDRTGKPLSFNTRKDVLRRLRQVFIWAYKTDRIEIDLSHLVPPASGSTPPRQPLSVSVLRSLLDAAALSSRPVRNQSIIALLAGTGIRRQECANLHVGDLVITGDGSGLLHVVDGKMGKSRTAIFDQSTGAYLCAWLKDRPDCVGESLYGLGVQGIYYVVRDAAEVADLRHLVRGPHDLRRLFIRFWTRHRKGNDSDQLLMKQVGHSSWATTMLYNQQDTNDLREAFISPLSEISQPDILPSQG